MQGTELEKLHSEAEDTINSALTETERTEKAFDVFFLLGGIDAVNNIARNLNAALIVNLQRIRDERLYLALGHDRFDDFMDNHPRSPMSYKRFNYIEGIFQNIGAIGFDLLTGSGLSMRQMKLLDAGDIQVEGNDVIIGGEERVSLGESRVMKAVVEKLVKEKIELQGEQAAAEKKAEKLKVQLSQGQSEFEILQRKYDAATSANPFERALMQSVYWLLELKMNVEDLTDADLAKRGGDDLKLLAGLWFRLRDSYHSTLALTDFRQENQTEFDRKVNEILEDGDLSQEEE